MAVKRMPFRTEVSGVADASGEVSLFWPPQFEVREGDEVHVTRIYIRNETNSGSSARVTVLSPGHEVRVWDTGSLTADTVVRDRFELVLTGGQRLKAAFSGATAGDRCVLGVEGYVRSEGE